MDLKQIDYFKAVAKHENITKAAEELFISQPALSMAIKRLEERIGAELFTRERKRIQLNEAGIILLKHIENIDEELNSAFNEIRKLKQKSKNIRFGAVNITYLRDVLQYYMLSNNVKVNFIYDEYEKLRYMLKNGQLDFALYSCEGDPPAEFDSMLLLNERLNILVPPGHKYYEKSFLTKNDIEKSYFWGLEPQNLYRQFTDNELAKKGIQLNYFIEDKSMPSIRLFLQYNYLVATYNSVSILAKENGVAYKPLLELDETQNIYLIYNGSALTDAAKGCLKFMRDNYFRLYRKALEQCEII